ncbi:MAG: Ig-like domain-containing protein [Fimbriimonadales bacterium]
MIKRIKMMRTAASAALLCIGMAAIAQGHVPGRVLVKFIEGTSVSTAHAAIMQVGGTTQRTLRGLATKVVAVPVGRETSAAYVLRASGVVEYAEVDGYAQPAAVPDDPWYANGGQGCAQWALLKIQCPAAWDITTGNSSVKLAIIDTGVDDIHEDLRDQITPGYNVASNNGNTFDYAGHGTIVAGTAAARSDNTRGVASVAWGVRIMPIRVTEENGTAPFSNFVEALDYAKNNGAKVANISWTPMWASGAVLDAARRFKQAGGLVVVAAGNNGAQINYNDFADLVVVGATDGNDVVTSYSNYGNLIDIVAPGSTFTTASTLGSQIYGNATGTSVATPYVSGAAALLFSLNPNFTPAQVEAFLESSADDRGPSGWDNRYGWGRLNVNNALLAAGGTPGGGDTTPPVVDILSPNAGATVGDTIIVLAEATDNVGVTEVRLMIDGNVVATDTTAPYQLTWDTTSWDDGEHSLRVRAVDAANNQGDDVITIVVNNKAPDITAPTVTITSPTNNASVSGNVAINATATDNVAVAFVEFFVDGVWQGADTTSPYSHTWDSQTVGNGWHTLKVVAEDTSGNRSSKEVSVNVTNTVPDTTPPTVSITSPSTGQNVNGSVNVLVSVWDNVGVVKCELYVNGQKVATSTAAPFTTKFNAKRYSGAIQLVVRAYDAANNVGVSAPITVYR